MKHRCVLSNGKKISAPMPLCMLLVMVITIMLFVFLMIIIIIMVHLLDTQQKNDDIIYHYITDFFLIRFAVCCLF